MGGGGSVPGVWGGEPPRRALLLGLRRVPADAVPAVRQRGGTRRTLLRRLRVVAREAAPTQQSRKVVTVLFADLRRLDRAQEQMDPESVRRFDGPLLRGDAAARSSATAAGS